ncbi:MAG TPA: hypothetical protein VGE81_07670, partial [Candidatus Limnocylindrales bacterium]
MERTLNKFIVYTIAALVVADILSHGAVSEALANIFFGTTGFFQTLSRLIAGQTVQGSTTTP